MNSIEKRDRDPEGYQREHDRDQLVHRMGLANLMLDEGCKKKRQHDDYADRPS
jgi:hypothetical protein